ncbi:response regulator transcription factor [Nocardioides flavescens]|uniref:Sensory transduction protein RegX3 n=1 Tax=Nocardioides flavescens TaxID=2691959 RepID=A0A6L7F1D3_9ACTN|nr:response regulator transcription factor [Nocardioides flavescens]MXG90202.1 response regulator [Nocardioides flavescens]
MKILVVEDDDSVAAALRAVLERHGHSVTRASRGDDALRRHRDADTVLLDLGLADGDGFDVLQALRQISTVPVVIVSARGDERSVVRGLHLGADDFLVKPIRMSELLARLEVVTRRRRPTGPAEGARFGDVEVDLSTRRVEVDGAAVALTTKEFDVLAVLARRPGEAVSKQLLLDEVWGDTSQSTARSLDVHLTQLRSKLGRPGLIETIRGYGYRIGAG